MCIERLSAGDVLNRRCEDVCGPYIGEMCRVLSDSGLLVMERLLKLNLDSVSARKKKRDGLSMLTETVESSSDCDALACPFASGRLVTRSVSLVQMRDVRNQWVVWVGVGEQGADGEQD